MIKTKPKSSNAANADSRMLASSITPQARRRMIAEAAYYRAQQRGFESGDPTEDWLRAEREIDQTLLSVGGERVRRPASDPSVRAFAAPVARPMPHVGRTK